MAKRGTPNFGNKVGDAYIEVHSEFDRKSAAKVEKEMAAAAEKSQKDLNLKRIRNDKEYIQRAHSDAIRMEQKRVQEMGCAPPQSQYVASSRLTIAPTTDSRR